MLTKKFLKKVFETKNLLTSLKLFALMIISAVIYGLVIALFGLISTLGEVGVFISGALIVLTMVSWLWVYGYLANKLWGWK